MFRLLFSIHWKRMATKTAQYKHMNGLYYLCATYNKVFWKHITHLFEEKSAIHTAILKFGIGKIF